MMAKSPMLNTAYCYKCNNLNYIIAAFNNFTTIQGWYWYILKTYLNPEGLYV